MSNESLDETTEASSPDAAASSRVPAPVPTLPPSSGYLAGAITQVAAALRFFSLIPVPLLPTERASHGALDLARGAPAVSFAGALIGVVAAAVLSLAELAGLPALLVASLGLAALVIVSGAMHEDGLADTADGLGGGATRERRLEIMRDSRSGVFGVVAIGLSLLLRVVTLATVVDQLGAAGAALVVVAVAMTSRTAGLLPLALLPAARGDGLGASAGAPTRASMTAAALVCLAASIGLLWPSGILVVGATLATAVAFAAAWGIARLAQARIGGHTGDIAGAAQQAAEIAMLIVLAALSNPLTRL